MQFGSAAKPPRGILFDSNFGESIDTVLALALLHGFEGKNQARIPALTISKSNLKAAQLCDVIEKFYTSALTGLAAIFFKGAPVGLAVDGKLEQDTPILTATLKKQDAAGNPTYSPRIQKLNDTAIVEVLMRNALTAQYDGNAAMVMAGPASNVRRLLDLKGAKSLIASKVKFLAITGGEFPNGKPEPNFAADLPAIRQVLAEWPTPIVMCGREVGNEFLFPAESIEKDFAYNPAHPVADAYRAYRAMPYDAPTWAMTAVLYAVRPDDGYFRLSEPGTVSIGDDGGVRFQVSANGNHRYLIADGGQKQRILKTYTEMASAKPAPRVFRRPVADEEKPDEKEKPANKPDSKPVTPPQEL